MTGAVLFVAFAFFAFAQAAVARNSAQSAADASALAAAQEARDVLVERLGGAITQGSDWLDVLTGVDDASVGVEQGAAGLAAKNGAGLVGGVSVGQSAGLPSFTVKVQLSQGLADSVVPGVQGKRAKASATAVVEPRCQASESQDEDLVEFNCSGVGDITIDPDDFSPDDLPASSDLFSVHLVG